MLCERCASSSGEESIGLLESTGIDALLTGGVNVAIVPSSYNTQRLATLSIIAPHASS
jgi:hypothetical protein